MGGYKKQTGNKPKKLLGARFSSFTRSDEWRVMSKKDRGGGSLYPRLTRER